MEKKITISYHWNLSDVEEQIKTQPSLKSHIQDTLEREAESRIFKMLSEGYTSGELRSIVEETEVHGWFEINSKIEKGV